MITCNINQLNIFIMKKVILSISAMVLSVFGFAQHGQGQHQHGGPGTTGAPTSLMQQIIVLLRKQVTTIQLLFSKLGINMYLKLLRMA
jgi:hypothetical protein